MRRYKKSALHKAFLFFLIVVLPVFIYKEFHLLSAKKDGGMPTQLDFYTTHPQADMDKSFVVVIPAYNNSQSVKRLFISLFSQHYQQFRVVYIDNGSTDDSLEKARNWVEKKGVIDRVTIIPCATKSEGCRAYFTEVSACEESDIIVHLEGADWLAHNNVLSRINTAYMSQDVMLTYGQYLEYPSYRKGGYKPRPKRNQYKKRVHRAPFVTSPFKTYYASLFKKIRKKEAITPEYFLTLESEKSLMMPLAELGKSHVRFIPEVLYIHNSPTRSRGLRLGTIEEGLAKTVAKAQDAISYDTELVLISEGKPYQLSICLESIQRHLQGVGRTTVLYEADDNREYARLQKQYPQVIFMESSSDLKEVLMDSLEQRRGGYVVLATDGIILQKDIALKECIDALERTKAYGFYFDLGKKRATSRLFEEEAVTVPRSFREAGIYSWFIEKGKGSFRHPNNLHLTLYRRSEIAKDLQSMQFDSPEALIDAWSKLSLTGRRGLFFDIPRALSID